MARVKKRKNRVHEGLVQDPKTTVPKVGLSESIVIAVT